MTSSHNKKKSFSNFIVDLKNRLFSKNMDAFSYSLGKTSSPLNINRVGVGNAFNRVGDDPNAPIFPEWFFSVPFGQPRRVDIVKMRTYARSHWIRMCVNTIIKAILRTPWDIVPKDLDDNTNYEKQIKQIKDFLEMPNQEGTSWSEIVTEFITDILEIDAGVFYMRRDDSMQRELLELYPVDAGSVLQDIDIHRRIRAYYQYTWRNPISAPLKYEKDEILYHQMNRASYRHYGWSPLMSVVQVIEMLIQSVRYNKDFFTNNGIPDGIVSVENASKESFKRVRNKWQEEIKGKPHRLMFMNGKIDFKPIVMTNRDMEWLDGEKWYMKTVFAMFGLSSASVGFYDDVNRAEGQNQSNNTDINAILPYMNDLSRVFTNKLIPVILGEENIPVWQRTPLMYKYFPIGTREEQITFENDLKELNANTMTINEFRSKRGKMAFDSNFAENPFEEKDIISAAPPVPPPITNNNPKPKPKDDPKKKIKSFINEETEFSDYYDLLEKTINFWESEVLKSLNIVNKSYDDVAYKTFGEFVQRIFNEINTSKFVNTLRKVVGKSVYEGVEEAETELNLDIGASEPISRTIDQLYSQQFDGYTINGKKWFGIKGVSQRLRQEILDEIKDSVTNRQSLGTMEERVKNIFNGMRDSDAMRIARTESNRFQNQGKLLAFKESGVKGKKVWKSVITDKTSDICKRLNGTMVELSDDFYDDLSGMSFQNPPAHPNCRSRIEFVPDDDNEEEEEEVGEV